MKKITFFLFNCFTTAICLAQTPAALQWQKCYGGTSDDYGISIKQTNDGGYILIGTTNSNNGDVTVNHGGNDVWVVKTNALGNVQWQKCYGGTLDDYGISIQQTSDGGFILTGYTYSNNGDVSGNHGDADVWVAKLNASGILQWQKCFGSVYGEVGISIQQTIDGGYILIGFTISNNNGDVSGNHGSLGSQDIWVVKLNASSVLQWQKCYGGTSEEMSTEIKQTIDGGYILTGYTNSNDGDVSGNHGGSSQIDVTSPAYDMWVIKLNSSGVIIWQKCFGGNSDEISGSVQETTDGGFIVGGKTYSNNGDVSGNHGLSDIWVAKLNASGVLQWQNCFGGSGDESVCSIQQTSDGSYILTGDTNSNDGDVLGNHGSKDIWVAKLNASGVLQWQKCYGGISYEYGGSIQQTYDGGFIFMGCTYSNNGNVSGNHGSQDNWVVKIIECNSTTNTSSTLNISSCSTYTTPLGQVLSNSGTYIETIPNHIGCDSTITINFTKYFPVTNNITVNTCSLPYIWNGQSYSSYGSYTQVLQTNHGCDSTVNLTLSYLPISNQNICIVGVESASGKNKVVWEKQQTQAISGYNIYRENSQSGSFDLIGSTLYSDSSVFLDINSNPIQQANRYKIKYIDSCGNEGVEGTTHKTLHLTINQGVSTTWNLIWTPYDGVSYPSYNIYRGSSASTMTLINTVASNITSYTDNNAPSGSVYYQIEIVGPNCNPTKSSYNNSRSNISSNDPSYLGISENKIIPISIYPNPASNLIHIDYNGNIEKLEIVDTKGAVVFVSKEYKKEYALPAYLQAGYYIVVIHDEKMQFRKELLIQR
jgi:hypothetical protein